MKKPTLKSIFAWSLLLLATTFAHAALKDRLDEVPSYSPTLPHHIYVERQTSAGDPNAIVGEYLDLQPVIDDLRTVEAIIVQRASHTLTWAGTSDTLTLATGFMRSGRVIKSLTIRHANAGTFDIGNRSVLNFYANDVVTTAAAPTVATMTNITWDLSDGNITVTPTTTHTGSMTVDIEYIDNPAPSYVTNEETLTLYAAAEGYTITDPAVQATIATTIETLSSGRNTVLFNSEGVPGVYVKIDPDVDTLSAPILAELGYTTSDEHPAFTVNGVAIDYFWVGKYEGTLIDVITGTVVSDASAKTSTALRVVSLKGLDPSADVTFDETVTTVRRNGAGYSPITNAQWAYLYLRSGSLPHEPRGNNSSGKDYVETAELGTLVAGGGYDAADIRVLTGADYVAWSHDNTAFGVWDLNGNVWEWVAGYRTNAGEIQIIADGDAAIWDGATGTDFGASSTEWKAILEDGSLVAPGTALTLKWDGTTTIDLVTTITTTGAPSTQFTSVTSSVTVPPILKALGLFELTAWAPARGRLYVNTDGERLPFRGGAWSHSSNAGVSALNGSNTRGFRLGNIGLRPAFVD